MTLTIQIPAETEEVLREAFGQDLGRAALDAMVAEGYRAGKLTLHEVRTLLRLAGRSEAEAWLGARGVFRNYGPEDLEADREVLRRTLGPIAD